MVLHHTLHQLRAWIHARKYKSNSWSLERTNLAALTDLSDCADRHILRAERIRSHLHDTNHRWIFWEWGLFCASGSSGSVQYCQQDPVSHSKLVFSPERWHSWNFGLQSQIWVVWSQVKFQKNRSPVHPTVRDLFIPEIDPKRFSKHYLRECAHRTQQRYIYTLQWMLLHIYKGLINSLNCSAVSWRQTRKRQKCLTTCALHIDEHALNWLDKWLWPQRAWLSKHSLHSPLHKLQWPVTEWQSALHVCLTSSHAHRHAFCFQGHSIHNTGLETWCVSQQTQDGNLPHLICDLHTWNLDYVKPESQVSTPNLLHELRLQEHRWDQWLQLQEQQHGNTKLDNNIKKFLKSRIAWLNLDFPCLQTSAT